MSQILQICSHRGSVDLDETFRKENFENASPTSWLLVFLKFWGQSDEWKAERTLRHFKKLPLHFVWLPLSPIKMFLYAFSQQCEE